MENISGIFSSSREAFDVLKKYSVRQRVSLFKKTKEVLRNNIDAAVDIICRETGKVKAEALISDIFPSLDVLDYHISNLENILKPVKVKTSLMFFGSKCSYEYSASGPAFIIGPWNFPFQLVFVPVVSALAAGCSVIFKPSELTPDTGKFIERIFKEAGYPAHSVQCVQGGAAEVQEAIKNKPSRVLFTGSTKTGKEIGKLCGEMLIPAVLELGGKAPAVVLYDADMERTVNGIVYGAFVNNGQVCVAVTRLIIDNKIRDKFIKLLADKAGKIVFNSDFGKLVQKERTHYLNSLIEEAVNKGAKVISGDIKDNAFEAPVLLDGVTAEMRIFNEECFAPVLSITGFDTEEEAVKLANSSVYGLSASVWSSDVGRAKRIAANIEAGNISINDSVKAAGVSSLPFGGIKDSGYGRYHGEDGVLFFSDKVSYLINGSGTPSEINWIPYNKNIYTDFKSVLSGKINPGKLLKLLKLRKRK